MFFLNYYTIVNESAEKKYSNKSQAVILNYRIYYYKFLRGILVVAILSLFIEYAIIRYSPEIME